MKQVLIAIVLCYLSISTIRGSAGERFLVKDGTAHAEIVIAEKPPRTTRLAAQELQTYVEKISGASLPIVTEPNPRRNEKALATYQKVLAEESVIPQHREAAKLAIKAMQARD